MEDSILSAVCKSCGSTFGHGRYLLGYRECLPCGEKSAKRKVHTIVPVPKSNYVYAHTADDVVSPYSHKGTR